jgi:aminoglycoside phosphotransferase family enzyme
VSVLAAIVEETLATLVATTADARRLSELARFCRATRAAFGSELADRATAGLVRDGHGDLRAEHILLGVDIKAIDGVEFDRDLRVADAKDGMSRGRVEGGRSSASNGLGLARADVGRAAGHLE